MNWLQHLLRLPQTYWLLVGVALGYGVLLRWQGMRLVVWVVGGAIALLTLLFWAWENRPKPRSQGAEDNLLDAAVFLERLRTLERRLPVAAQPEWTQAAGWVKQTHAAAAQIAIREPALMPDLLEALHTVLDLADQVVEGLQVSRQVQTTTYRQLAGERLQMSCDRLRETHDQMQQLRDQLALSALEQQAAQTNPLPAQLRLLIADNKTMLQSVDPSSSP